MTNLYIYENFIGKQGRIGQASYRKNLGEPLKAWIVRGSVSENKCMYKIRFVTY